MRKLLVGFVFFGYLFLSILAYAGTREGQQSFYDIVNKMKRELSLTEEQFEALKPIVKENMQKRLDLIGNFDGEATVSKSQQKIAMRKLKEEMNHKLSKFLTEGQMKKLIEKQHLKESLNKDKIDYSDGLVGGVALSPQGGSLQF